MFDFQKLLDYPVIRLLDWGDVMDFPAGMSLEQRVEQFNRQARAESEHLQRISEWDNLAQLYADGDISLHVCGVVDALRAVWSFSKAHLVVDPHLSQDNPIVLVKVTNLLNDSKPVESTVRLKTLDDADVFWVNPIQVPGNLFIKLPSTDANRKLILAGAKGTAENTQLSGQVIQGRPEVVDDLPDQDIQRVRDVRIPGELKRGSPEWFADINLGLKLDHNSINVSLDGGCFKQFELCDVLICSIYPEISIPE